MLAFSSFRQYIYKIQRFFFFLYTAGVLQRRFVWQRTQVVATICLVGFIYCDVAAVSTSASKAAGWLAWSKSTPPTCAFTFALSRSLSRSPPKQAGCRCMRALGLATWIALVLVRGEQIFLESATCVLNYIIKNKLSPRIGRRRLKI